MIFNPQETQNTTIQFQSQGLINTKLNPNLPTFSPCPLSILHPTKWFSKLPVLVGYAILFPGSDHLRENLSSPEVSNLKEANFSFNAVNSSMTFWSSAPRLETLGRVWWWKTETKGCKIPKLFWGMWYIYIYITSVIIVIHMMHMCLESQWMVSRVCGGKVQCFWIRKDMFPWNHHSFPSCVTSNWMQLNHL